MYKVIKAFADLTDNNHPYSVGDKFPRAGVEVTEARLDELAGSNNKQGQPLIRLVKEHAKKTTAKRATKTAEE